MKKINITYISNNKKIFNGVKLVGLGTAFCLLTSCSTINNDIVDKSLPNEIVAMEKSSQNITTVAMEATPMDHLSSTLNRNLLESVPIWNLDNKLEPRKTATEIVENVKSNLEEAKEDKDNLSIDISKIILSDREVSTYNTDFQINSELRSKINGYISDFGASCSFLVINLNDGMSFGYNIDASYQTASTIKAPFALYSFKEMDKGNGTLTELKLYEEKFRRDGSGLLKNQKSGTSYSLKDLFYYTLNYSDNVAYYMLHDRFYNEHYNNYLKELGCNSLYLYSGAKWGFIDARSIAIVWQEIYKYKDETENGQYLFDLLKNAQYNYINEGMASYESAHKSGWTPRETHDSGIVFAEDDYIVVTLNNNNGNYSAKNQLLKICECIENVIDEYTLYKQLNQDKTLSK